MVRRRCDFCKRVKPCFAIHSWRLFSLPGLAIPIFSLTQAASRNGCHSDPTTFKHTSGYTLQRLPCTGFFLSSLQPFSLINPRPTQVATRNGGHSGPTTFKPTSSSHTFRSICDIGRPCGPLSPRLPSSPSGIQKWVSWLPHDIQTHIQLHFRTFYLNWNPLIDLAAPLSRQLPLTSTVIQR